MKRRLVMKVAAEQSKRVAVSYARFPTEAEEYERFSIDDQIKLIRENRGRTASTSSNNSQSLKEGAMNETKTS